MNPAAYTQAEIKAMREWIAECCWMDLQVEDVADLTPAEVVAGIRAHFDGGEAEFMRTLEPVNPNADTAQAFPKGRWT